MFATKPTNGGHGCDKGPLNGDTKRTPQKSQSFIGMTYFSIAKVYFPPPGGCAFLFEDTCFLGLLTAVHIPILTHTHVGACGRAKGLKLPRCLHCIQGPLARAVAATKPGGLAGCWSGGGTWRHLMASDRVARSLFRKTALSMGLFSK